MITHLKAPSGAFKNCIWTESEERSHSSLISMPTGKIEDLDFLLDSAQNVLIKQNSSLTDDLRGRLFLIPLIKKVRLHFLFVEERNPQHIWGGMIVGRTPLQTLILPIQHHSNVWLLGSCICWSMTHPTSFMYIVFLLKFIFLY